MPDHSFAEISAALKCEPETGRLFWLPRPPSRFSTVHACNAWNARFAGREAFTSHSSDGYLVGSYGGRQYRAHRIVWLLVTGRWPKAEIDHINGARDDNRLENLREVSRAENNRNKRRHAHNSSGQNGVCWLRESNKWFAQIGVNGRTEYLGCFDTIEAAIAARADADHRHGFSIRHGEPCPTSKSDALATWGAQ